MPRSKTTCSRATRSGSSWKSSKNCPPSRAKYSSTADSDSSPIRRSPKIQPAGAAGQMGDHQNARRIESGAERLYARMDLAGLHPREQARPVKDLASGDSAPFPASIAGQVIAGKACGIRQHALERISYSAIFEAISLSIHIVSFGYIFSPRNGDETDTPGPT